MVNQALPDAPSGAREVRDRDLALAFAPRLLRPAFAALLALDARFAGIIRTTREPMVGQMRMTWWHDAIARLDDAPAPGEPLLRDLQAHVLPRGIAGAELATLSEGWDVLLDPLDEAAIVGHGEGRGARLFAFAGRLMPGDWQALAAAGRGWALADLAAHVSQPAVAERAAVLADAAFRTAFAGAWPASARPLGALAMLQRLRIAGGTSVGDFARLTRFRLTGR